MPPKSKAFRFDPAPKIIEVPGSLMRPKAEGLLFFVIKGAPIGEFSTHQFTYSTLIQNRALGKDDEKLE